MVLIRSGLDTEASKKGALSFGFQKDEEDSEDEEEIPDTTASKKFWFQEDEESSEDEDEEEKLNRCVQEQARDRFVQLFCFNFFFLFSLVFLVGFDLIWYNYSKVDYMTQYCQENPDVVQSRQKREEIISAGVKVWDNMSESEKARYFDWADKRFARARDYVRRYMMPRKVERGDAIVTSTENSD